MSDLGAALELKPEAVQQIQGAMGEKLFEIVRFNIGKEGVDRPRSWAALSPKYAKRVGRDYATLDLTGALAGAIKFDNSNPDFASVSISDSDVIYATSHQWGDGHLPARPYFPMSISGEFTTFTTAAVLEAAQEELSKIQG